MQILIQRAHTCFLWLEVPEMKELVETIYDTESSNYLTVN